MRRRLAGAELKVKEHIIGRQTLTPVDVLWLDGIANKDTVRLVEQRIDAIDIDGLLSTGNLEEYIVDEVDTRSLLLPIQKGRTGSRTLCWRAV